MHDGLKCRHYLKGTIWYVEIYLSDIRCPESRLGDEKDFYFRYCGGCERGKEKTLHKTRVRSEVSIPQQKEKKYIMRTCVDVNTLKILKVTIQELRFNNETKRFCV